MEKAESLRVTRGDFFASLENDIKPVSGHCGTPGAVHDGREQLPAGITQQWCPVG